MKKLATPCVCREALTDHPILVVSHANGRVTAIMREDGRRLTLTDQAEMWVGTHVFPIHEDPKAYAEVLKAYALHCGADPDAARALGRLTKVTEEEYVRMTNTTKAPAKKPAATKAPAKPKAAPKPKAADAAKPKADAKPKATEAERAAANKERLAKLNETKKAKRETAEPKAPRRSASARFQELIMAGGKSADQIFAIVQKEFGLSDDKKSYVNWNLNKLRKDGKNPPELRK